jgi:hypothetical protein
MLLLGMALLAPRSTIAAPPEIPDNAEDDVGDDAALAGPTPVPEGDPYLAYNLERELHEDAGLAEVHVRLGTIGAGDFQVIVDGVVDRAQERRRAQRIVESFTPDGIKVENRVRVRHGPHGRTAEPDRTHEPR